MRQSWIARLLQFDRDDDTFIVRNPDRGPGDGLFGGMIAAQAASMSSCRSNAPVTDGRSTRAG
jgi:hypothetical protein